MGLRAYFQHCTQESLPGGSWGSSLKPRSAMCKDVHECLHYTVPRDSTPILQVSLTDIEVSSSTVPCTLRKNLKVFSGALETAAAKSPCLPYSLSEYAHILEPFMCMLHLIHHNILGEDKISSYSADDYYSQETEKQKVTFQSWVVS